MVGLAHRGLAGAHALGEGMETLVRQPVVVLDDVDARAREEAAERGEPLDGEADWLERGAGERALAHGGQVAQAERAELRTGQRLLAPRPFLWVRQLEVGELNVLLDRRVAEEDVEELRRVVAGRADGKIDDDRVLVRAERGHGDEPADDVLEHERIAQRGARQLDGLLQQQRLDAGVKVVLGRGGDVVRDAQRGPRGRGFLRHERKGQATASRARRAMGNDSPRAATAR